MNTLLLFFIAISNLPLVAAELTILYLIAESFIKIKREENKKKKRKTERIKR